MTDPQDLTSEHQLDLALAAELQAALLPRSCPTGCPQQVAAARNRMCATIGGDFHDFMPLNADQIAIVVGDVVGHGVRASLLMAQTMGFLRSMSPQRRSRPTEVVRALNQMLIELGDRTNTVLPCTIFYAVIDSPSGVTFFVNAGHPRPFLCSDGSCQPLAAPQNPLLGVQPFEPEEDCITFSPGQRLVLYTDGLSDAMDPASNRFGELRLRDLVHAHASDAPQPCADAIFAAVDAYRQGAPQRDDETVVVIDRL